MLFLFPNNLEHPESTGRLELFARYGPVDSEGRLRGGISGAHVHTDLEIRQMIAHETRERLFKLFNKPRATVEIIVDALMPKALDHNYTWAEVKKMLKVVEPDSTGRLDFSQMQRIILDSQQQRLRALLKHGTLQRERGPRVPFQSKAADVLMAITRKKKLNPQEEQMCQQKRLGKYCTLIASMEDQNQGNQLATNVALVRGLGSVNDRWDRYCALRRTGKISYVQARNTAQQGGAVQDDGCADKHAGSASLIASMVVR